VTIDFHRLLEHGKTASLKSWIRPEIFSSQHQKTVWTKYCQNY